MFHKSAKGRVVNFDELAHKNATTIAVGNANLNARGDLVGPGGKIIETAEQRDSKADAVVTTTSRVSIQSEISSLRNARSQWVNETPNDEQTVEETPVVEIQENVSVEETPVVENSTKKSRKITETE